MITEVGAAVGALIDNGASTIVVVAPGRCGRRVTDAIIGHVDAAGPESSRIEVVAGSRRSAPGDVPLRDEAGIVVAAEAQWLPEETLGDLAATTRSAIVIVHRPCPIDGALATFHAAAYEDGARLELAPTPVADIDVSVDADAAFAATAGWPDLLDSWVDDGSLAPSVAIDLGLLDETARSVAELLACGADVSDLRNLLDVAPDEIDDALASVELEGLTRSGAVPAGVARAVLEVTPPGRRERAIERLGSSSSPGAIVGLADVLAAIDDRGEAAASVALLAATQLLDVDAERARRHLDRAAEIGGPAITEGVAFARTSAEIEMRRGNPDAALQALAAVPAADHDAEVQLLAATAWRALGDLSAAIAPLRASSMPALETWARIGAGDDLLDLRSGDREPGVADDAASDAVATALAHWWEGAGELALDSLGKALVRYAATPPRSWPVTPHEVMAIVASRLGELDRAREAVDSAVAERAGGHLHRSTNLLLSAWLAARQGRLDDAVEAQAEVPEDGLTPRQTWLRSAVTCAIAVRDPEPGEMTSAAADAQTAAGRIAVDQYDLELTGEVAAAVERAGIGTIDDVLRPFTAGVDRDDGPAHVAFDVERVRLAAAMSTDDVATASRAAHAVIEHPSPPDHGSITTEVAQLVAGLAEGDVDLDRTTRLADDLAAAGRLHEAARLSGLAAVHAGDPRAARRLLKQSRALRLQRARVRGERGPDRTVVRLSPQEERVAQYIDAGLTYKEIAAELIISPKTVEHHVAHIRTKLAAGSRAELVAAIRAYFDDPASSDS